MLSKTRLDFILHLTNFFDGHYEDPEWGMQPSTQILIALAVRELATGIKDSVTRKSIHSAADQIIAKNSQAMTKTSA